MTTPPTALFSYTQTEPRLKQLVRAASRISTCTREFIDAIRHSVPIDGEPNCIANLPGFSDDLYWNDMIGCSRSLKTALYWWEAGFKKPKLLFYEPKEVEFLEGSFPELLLATVLRFAALIEEANKGVEWIGSVFSQILDRLNVNNLVPLGFSLMTVDPRKLKGTNPDGFFVRSDELRALEEACNVVETKHRELEELINETHVMFEAYTLDKTHVSSAAADTKKKSENEVCVTLNKGAALATQQLTPGSRAVAAALDLRREGRRVSIKAACERAHVCRTNEWHVDLAYRFALN